MKENSKIKKFDLKFDHCFGKNNEYSQYIVIGLDCAYYGPGKNDFANGACGLIKQENYPGYCQLCFVYHTPRSENFENGYTVEFMPLITKDGERILIKYDYDCLMCDFTCGRLNYTVNGERKRDNGTITFYNKGTCKLWDEEKTK